MQKNGKWELCNIFRLSSEKIIIKGGGGWRRCGILFYDLKMLP
jgi:hypothetical protein